MLDEVFGPLLILQRLGCWNCGSFGGGLTMEESAEALNVSEGTVRRDWRFAKTGSCAN